MEILQRLLREHGPALIQSLVGKAGFDAAEAESFLPSAAKLILGALQGGSVDLGALLGGGGASELVSGLDAGALAADTGVTEAKARSGLAALAPDLLGLVQGQAGGAKDLLAGLTGEGKGGILGAAGGLAGKLLK